MLAPWVPIAGPIRSSRLNSSWKAAASCLLVWKEKRHWLIGIMVKSQTPVPESDTLHNFNKKRLWRKPELSEVHWPQDLCGEFRNASFHSYLLSTNGLVGRGNDSRVWARSHQVLDLALTPSGCIIPNKTYSLCLCCFPLTITLTCPIPRLTGLNKTVVFRKDFSHGRCKCKEYLPYPNQYKLPK